MNGLNAKIQITIVSKASGKRYTVTVPNSDAPAYCSCPAWKFQKLSPKDRTCKHLRAINALPVGITLHDGMAI